MDRIKEKLKMGQRKSKQAANCKNGVENTKSSSKSNSENTGSNSPPRRMKDILTSESKTKEFRSFLTSIDQENEDDKVEVMRLDFILACRQMQQLLSGKSSNPLSTQNSVLTVTRYVGGSSSPISSHSEHVSMDVIAVKVQKLTIL